MTQGSEMSSGSDHIMSQNGPSCGISCERKGRKKRQRDSQRGAEEDQYQEAEVGEGRQRKTAASPSPPPGKAALEEREQGQGSEMTGCVYLDAVDGADLVHRADFWGEAAVHTEHLARGPRRGWRVGGQRKEMLGLGSLRKRGGKGAAGERLVGTLKPRCCSKPVLKAGQSRVARVGRYALTLHAVGCN